MEVLPKKFVIIFLSIFFILVALVKIEQIKTTRPSQADRDIYYVAIDFNDSWHDDEYVYFKNSVSWRNSRKSEVWGYAYAVIPNKDEEKLYAYDTDTGEKMLVYMKAGANIDTVLVFRGTWMGEYSKGSRTEPVDIVFEPVDINSID